MKEKIKLSKKQKIIGLSVLAIILVIIGIACFILNKPKANNYIYNSDLERAEIEQSLNYDKVNKNDSTVNEYINFDAYFTRDLDGDGYTEGVRGSCIQIGKQDTLYLELQVNIGGELRNAQIDINGDNFYFETVLPKSEEIAENAISDNTKTIYLQNIGAGEQITLTGNVNSGVYSSARTVTEALGNDITKLSNNKDSENRNSVTLTGTHVIKDPETGEEIETPITKTVYFDLDWHGTTSTTLPAFFGDDRNFNYKDQNKNLEGIVDEEKGEVKLSFEILTRENDYELNLSKSEIEIEIPKLNGYAPINVEANDADVEKLINDGSIVGAKITKEASLDENMEKVEKEAYTNTFSDTNAYYRYNKFNLTITYPIEAYDAIGGDSIQLIMPVKAHYEGYNNPNIYFQNPYKSEVAKDTIILTFSNPQGDHAIFHVRVGKYISYPWWQYVVANRNPIRVWNGIGENIENDTYDVRWEAYTGSEGEINKITLRESEGNLSDELFVGNEFTSMEEFVSNVGISFSDPTVILGKDGWIKVYDDDDDIDSEPIVTFTAQNWNRYYKYDEPIKHIRIETSAAKSNSYLYIYNKKEVDTNYVTDNFSKEEYLKYDRIRSRVCGYTNDNYVNEDIYWAYYQKTVSLATVSLSEDKISTTETHNLKIYIDTLVDEDNNQDKWKNGRFLLKLPKEITAVEINDVYANNSNIKSPLDYEIDVKDGYTFIKIMTENIEPASYRITVDCDVTPNATSLTQTRSVELYAINENCANYPEGYTIEDIYDLNDNGNFIELVNYSATSLNLISINNLLTSEIVSNYDNTGVNKTYSPKVAGVSREDRTARINVVINNNYSGTNSEVVILGRIPFEGNKYVNKNAEAGIENDLKSEFTAIMNNSGINVPEELKGIVTIYYSENGEATTDFNEANNWQTVPMDFSKIKSYMIYFDKTYKLQRGEIHEFYYDVTIPEDVELNKESYSHHAIYFCWDTPQGKHRTEVKPGKVGITPVEKFDLQLTKYQTALEKRVSGAYYSVTEIKTNEEGEEERGNSKTAVTKEDGTLIIKDLYVDKVYEIKEIKTPDSHELNSDIIRIYTSINDENNEISVEKIYGKTRADITVNQTERKIYLEVEDNVAAKLKILKTDKDNNEIKIANVRYKITGDGLPESGSVITTNAEGIAEIQGLKAGKKYTLQEIKAATGYYLEEAPVEITVLTTDNINYNVEINGKIKSSNLEVIADSPVVTINLTNERIPIFKILKTDKNTGDRLGKVKYKISGKGFAENGTKLVTNENGEIQLLTLYLNEEYTLQETKALEGYYTKSEEIKFQILNDNGNYSLKINNGQNIVKSTETTDTNGIPTLVLTMENEKIPTFTLDLTKIEKDKPEKLLEGAKFRLYRDEKQVGEYISDENGKIVIEGLYQYEEGKEFNSTYTLTEVEAPNGYSVMKDIVFKVQNVDGTLKFIEDNANAEAPRNYEVVGNTIKLMLENSPSFKLIKVDGEQTKEVRLPNTKFVIYNIDGEEETPALDSKGKIVGTKEAIDGKEYYTLTTDPNGEFTVDLAEGFYKAIEVKANSEKFDITNQTYYFGIGKSKRSIELKLDMANSMIQVDPTTIINTIDGGSIRYRQLWRNEELDIGNGELIKVEPGVEGEGIIAKYDNLGNLEWYNVIKITEYYEEANYQNFSNIHNVIESSLGEIIVQIASTGKSIQVADNVTITNPHKNNGINLLVKYDNNGSVLDYEEGDIINISDYARSTDYLTNNDVIVLELEGEEFDIGNGIILRNDQMYKKCDGHSNDWGGWYTHGSLEYCDNQIDAYYRSYYMIKYNENKEIEWCKKISAENDDVEIQRITKYGDKYSFNLGRHRYPDQDINFGNRILSNRVNILYDINQSENEAIVLPADIYINEIDDTGFFASINFEHQTTLSNGETVHGESDVTYLKIRYDLKGNIQWYTKLDDKIIDKEDESCKNYNDCYAFFEKTSDDGYIAGSVCTSEKYVDGNIERKIQSKLIKYNSNREIDWEKAPIENSNEIIFEHVIDVKEGYLVGIYVKGSSTLENNITLEGAGYGNNYIALYDKNGNIKWAVEGYLDYETTELPDKEFIVTGSIIGEKTIDFGNNVKITGRKDEQLRFTVKYDQNGVPQYGFLGFMYENKINDQEFIIMGRIEEEKSVNLGNNIIMNGPTNFFIQYDNNNVVKVVDADFYRYYKTSDNGALYIVYNAKDFDWGDGNIIPEEKEFCAYIVKCNSNLEIEWYKNYVPLNFDIAQETADGGIIAVAYNYSEEPLNLGNGVILEHDLDQVTTALIKYNKNGIVEWAKTLESDDIDVWNLKISEEENNIIQVTGDLYGTMPLEENKTIGTPENYTDFLIRFTPQEVDTQVEVESAYQIGGDYHDYLDNVVATDDGGYITSGRQTTSSNGSQEYIITKYNSEGQEQWKNIVPDNKSIASLDKTSDSGCIVILNGNSASNCYMVKYDNNGNVQYQKSIEYGISAVKEYSEGEYIVTGTTSTTSRNGILIKYKETEEKNDCEVIIEKLMTGNISYLQSLNKTLDGGIIVGGAAYLNDDIDCGNGVVIPKNNEFTRLSNGIIIKYDKEGNAEYAKVTDKWIRNVESTSDGGYITLQWNNLYSDSDIIKYNRNGNEEWKKSNTKEYIDSIKETADGGYIYASTKGIDYNQHTFIKYLVDIVKLDRNGNEEWKKEIESDEEFVDCILRNVVQLKNGSYVAVGSFGNESLNLGNRHILENNSYTHNATLQLGPSESIEKEVHYYDGMIVTLNAEKMIPEKQEITVSNFYKRHNITTEVELVNGEKGGTISGENLTPYEKVIHGEASTKPIEIKAEEYYELVNVTINGEEYPITSLEYNEETGIYTMPKDGVLTNVIDDIHIVVTFCYTENKFTIKKIDSQTKEPLKGAKFEITPNEEMMELDILDTMKANTGIRDTNMAEPMGGSSENTQEAESQIRDTGVATEIGDSEEEYYYFEKSEDGSYKSNNQGKDETIASSRIEVDLTDYEGMYLLEVNASISSSRYDEGRVYVIRNDILSQGGQGMLSQGGQSMLALSNTNDEESNNSEGFAIIRPIQIDLVNISGEVEPQNYRTTLMGGAKYTVYFEYEKIGFGTAGEDTFTINSVTVRRAITNTTVVETNETGEITTELLFGKYKVTEIEAPDGYILNDETFEIDFQRVELGQDPEEVHTIIVENTKKPKVTVHYYKIDEDGTYTTESLAEDVVLTGNPEEKYTTDIIKKLEKDGIEYELENNISEDGTKTYVIPDNSTGKFILGEDQEVIYYYMEKKTPLIVHHYIQGTNIGVPLADGTLAKDERFTGKEGDPYTTDALTEEELSKEYELVAIPENSTGTYGKNEIIVTYYYKKIDKNVSIFKYALEKQVNEETGLEEDVKVPLAGAEFTISEKPQDTISDLGEGEDGIELLNEVPKYITDENGKIDLKLEVGEYEITEVKAPEGYVLPEGDDATQTITVDKTTEDGQLIEIQNKKVQGTVIVYHYKIDENGEYTETPVQVKSGENLVDAPVETQTGDVGSIYATKPVENLPINWKYVEARGETSGTYIDGTIEVKYYYREVDFEEKINIEVTKIWKDNDIQALRRPKTIKFVVTPYIENVEQVFSGETIVSEEYYGNPENINSGNANDAETSKDKPEITEDNAGEAVGVEDIVGEIASAEDDASEIVAVDENTSEDADVQNNMAPNIDNTDVTSDELSKSETKSEQQINTSEDISPVNVPEEPVVSEGENVNQDATQEQPVTENAQSEEVTQNMKVCEFVVNVQAGESFTYTLEDLPKYDKSTGSVIHYKITETYDENPDDLKFYTSQGGEVIELIDEAGNIKYTSRIVNTFTLPSDNVKDIKGIKVWKDNENVRNTRPLSIILELVGRINKTNVNNETEAETIISKEQGISAGNDWQHIFTGNPIYNENGEEIEYSVDEKESIELNKYSKTITSNENKSEFTIINSLNVRSSNIIKTGTEKLRAIDGKVNYKINYTAELDVNYEDENIIVTVVDKLPYAISEKERNIAGGVYDEDAKTITWTGTYNTKAEEQVVVWNDGSKTPITLSEEKQVKVVTLNKTISFSYLGLTMEDENKTIVNNVSGTIKLAKSEEEVTAQCRTIIEWKQDVIVNKLWIGDTEETRPDSIQVALKQVVEDENGNVTLKEIADSIQTITPNTTENGKIVWTYTYKDLPRYDADGKELKYTVDETKVNYTKGEQAVENVYYCEKTEEDVDGNTVVTLTNNKYGSIIVTKVDSRDDSITLSGAEFKLEKMIQDESGEWIVPDKESEDYISYAGTTNEAGTLTFEGLKYGKYKLTETKAPENYRIAEKDIDIIEVNGEDAEHLNVQVTVKNDKKYSLPTTGGVGTNIIRSATALIGIILIILLTNKKKVTLVRRAKTENKFKPVRRIKAENNFKPIRRKQSK